MNIKSLRGMNDILPPEINLWQKVEATLRDVSGRFGFSEMRTPMLENTQLFKRGVGEDTDIVEKEMYSFDDRNGENVSLRPEGTAPIVRAMVEHNIINLNPVSKIYYIGAMFRHERPQKGRFRQFYQYGIELFGVEQPEADVEVISVMSALISELKLTDIELHISSLGCKECRAPYQKMLTEKLNQIKDQIPEDFHKRIAISPQRIFDQKDEKSKAVAATLPLFKDHLCEACCAHFSKVQSGLKDLKINFVEDWKIVRGLDYYNRTAFEFMSKNLGAQGTVCGGGRYDGLFESLGGDKTPAIGFGMGLERIVMLMQLNQKASEQDTDLSIVYLGEDGQKIALQKAFNLRKNGFVIEVDLQNRSLKAQMKVADRVNSKFSIVIGSEEIKSGKVKLKNMKERKETVIDLSELEGELQKHIRGSWSQALSGGD